MRVSVFFRPGSFKLPTILVEGKARDRRPALSKRDFGAGEGDDGQKTWKCASDPAHVVVFSKG